MIRPSPPPLPPIDPELDRRFMRAAIGLARRNNGQTWPNPSVGAIVVRTDGGHHRVVGRGTTARGGRPHAEVMALREAGAEARGATVYVTLEPCAHHGKTPPCADALIDFGVARVVSAIEDPDPRVAGKGNEMLRTAGIAVTTGVLAAEAIRLHAGHLSRIRRQTPQVILKMAISADGYIGRRGGGQVPISGPLSKAYALGLRAVSDAIMVGIGTVLEDDPELTCRLPGLFDRSPVRVVLDAAARTPLSAKLVTSATTTPTWIVVAPDADPARVSALAAAGVRIITAERGRNGRIDLEDVLHQLAGAGITSVIVEGGAMVARAMVEADLIDEIHLVRSPYIVGDKDGVPALGGLDVDRLTDPAVYETLQNSRLGDDRFIHLWHRKRS